jgi:energy-coupling factor transporter ATP-binding protein EcfA2
MRQRVSLARALAATTAVGEAEGRPGMLLMDEPFAALDAITRDVLQAELLRVWEASGTTVLFVTHDVREAIRLAERVVLLSSRPGTVVREWRVGEGRWSCTGRSPDDSDRSSPAMPHEPTPLHSTRSTDDENLMSTPRATAVLEDAAAAVAGLDALDTPTTTTRPWWRRALSTGVPPLVALVVFMLVWQAVWASAITDEYKVPSPAQVWQAFAKIVEDGQVWSILWTSISRAFLGFVVALIIATPLGLLVPGPRGAAIVAAVRLAEPAVGGVGATAVL